MATLKITTRAGQQIETEAIIGATFLDNIRKAGVDEIAALCGGGGACATCHIKVEPAFFSRLSPMSDMEDAMLDGIEYRSEHSRLACQVVFDGDCDGLSVVIAEEE